MKDRQRSKALERESKQEAFASGTNLFLTKPVKLGEIKKLLEHEQVRGKDPVGT